MKKYIWISAILLVISCGSRKSKTEKQTEKTDFQTGQNLSKTEELETTSETTIDYAKFFQEIGLKIKSSGSDYQFQIGDFKFAGNADVEFSNKKEETKTKIFHRIETIYKSKITYKTETTYKTQTIFKSKETERETYPWYWIVLGTILIWELLKLATKKYLGKFLERFQFSIKDKNSPKNS